MSDFKSAGPQHLQLHCVGAFSTRQPDSSPCDGLPLRLYWIHLVTFWTWTQSGKGRAHGDGGGGGRERAGMEKTTRPHKTFRKQRLHQTGIMPHCGGWMWLIVFAGGSGRKREGRHVMFEVDLIVIKKKKLQKKNWFVVWIEQDIQDVSDVTSEADLCFWDGRQEVAPGGWEVAECYCECVSFNTHKHLNTRVLSQNW